MDALSHIDSRNSEAREEADKLAIHFGGVKAVDGVDFEITEGEIFTIIGPNGAGKTTIFNLISRIYEPTEGKLIFNDEDITNTAPHLIAGRGIARTFQNIELFEQATVLQNLLIGRHAHRSGNLLATFPLSDARSSTNAEYRLQTCHVLSPRPTAMRYSRN